MEDRISGGRTSAEDKRPRLQSVGAGLAMLVLFVAVLSIPLNAAPRLGLSPAETTGWIMAVYGLPGALAVILSARYRQPLLITGNIFILILVVRLGGDFPWSELVGASVVAGLIVVALGALGLTQRLARWLPSPIVFGLLAGAVLPFFVGMFTQIEDSAGVVLGSVAVYLLARRYLEPRVPAILPALVAAFLIAGIGGEFQAPATGLAWTAPRLIAPAFSIEALLAVTPLMVILITIDATIPSVVFLRQQGYDPPETAVTAVSGTGTVAAAFLGPNGVSLSLAATALCAGPEAGPLPDRYRSVYVAGGGSLAIGLFAGVAAAAVTVLPPSLLITVAGLAVAGIVAAALPKVTQGPLRWGPLFAFGIALADFTLLGLTEFFWAIVGGLAVSALLERDAWPQVNRDDPAHPSDAAAHHGG